MTQPAIRLRNLSKCYRIGALQKRHETLVSATIAALRSPAANLRRLRALSSFQSTDDTDVIWALREVSFEVQTGEVLGIIGRNGAGKSTLLKVLSRITSPTSGRVELAGRVASLLEVGTGFHPELTGRENIYLNGTILGMRKTEVDAKLDEIIDFSGVGPFIDTPLKRYSSGMAVRLAFSVAAHLDAEILLVDEVLAVGDASFQRRCLGKLDRVSREGRTILLVSHQMAAIKKLCDRAIQIDAGTILRDGPTSLLVAEYLRDAFQRSEHPTKFPASNHEVGLSIHSCQVSIPERHPGVFDLLIDVEIRAEHKLRDIGVGIRLVDLEGTRVATLGPMITGHTIEILEGDVQLRLRCLDVGSFLGGGDYLMDIWLARPRIEYLVRVQEALVMNVPATDRYGSGLDFEARRFGLVPLPLELEILTERSTGKQEVPT